MALGAMSLRRGRHRRARESDQAGSTLVEQLAVLGVGGTLLLGSVTLGTAGYAGVAGNAGMQQAAALVASAKALKLGGSYGAGPMNAMLIKTGQVPADMPVDPAAGTIANAWGGAVTVTGAGRGFTLAFAGVPAGACVRLATMQLGTGPIGGGLADLSINGRSQSLPLSTGTATDACGRTGGNLIAWTFG
jgi:hypothetical protein